MKFKRVNQGGYVTTELMNIFPVRSGLILCQMMILFENYGQFLNSNFLEVFNPESGHSLHNFTVYVLNNLTFKDEFYLL